MPEVKVEWAGDDEFIGSDGTGRSLVMSGQLGDEATGLKPSDVMLIALGGCTGVDLVFILQKKRQNLTGLQMQVTAEQDPDPPWTFRKIHIEYTLSGNELAVPAVERAIRLAEHHYCSVGATLSGTAEITSSYMIIGDET